MACRLDVQRTIKTVVEDRIDNITTVKDGVAGVTYKFNDKNIAQIDKLNREFGEKVVNYHYPVYSDQSGYITIDISDSLYDKYIEQIDIRRNNAEIKRNTQEARKALEEDAKRAGQKYDDRYLFQRYNQQADSLTLDSFNPETILEHKKLEKERLSDLLKSTKLKIETTINELNKTSDPILQAKLNTELKTLTQLKSNLEDRLYKEDESISKQIKTLESGINNNSLNIIAVQKQDFIEINKIIDEHIKNPNYFNLDSLNAAEELLNMYSKFGDITDPNETHIFIDNLFDMYGASNLEKLNPTTSKNIIDTLLAVKKDAGLMKAKIEVIKKDALKRIFQDESKIGLDSGVITLKDLHDSIESTAVIDSNIWDYFFSSLDQTLSNDLMYHSQIALKIINQDIEDKKAYASKKKEELHTAFEIAKPFLNQFKKTFGITGYNYNVFRQIDQNGNLNNTLVNTFSITFDHIISEFNKKFKYSSKGINEYTKGKKGSSDDERKYNLLKYLKEYRNELNKQGLTTFNYYKLKEFYDNNSLITDNNNIDNSYRNQLINQLGINKYNELVNNAKIAFIRSNYLHGNPNNSFLNFENLLNSNDNTIKQYIEDNWNLKNGISVELDNILENIIVIPNNSISSINKYHDQRYKEISNTPELLHFLDLLNESWNEIHKYLPKDIEKTIGKRGLLTVRKSLSENILENANNKKGNTFKKVKNIVKDSILQVFTDKDNHLIDAETYNKVSTTDFNTGKKEIDTIFKIEHAEIRDLAYDPNFSSTTLKEYPAGELMKKPELVSKLAGYMNISPSDFLSGLTPTMTVNITQIINDFAKRSFYESQSFDMMKLTEYYLDATMLYAARLESKNKLELLIGNIKDKEKIRTSKTGRALINKKGNITSDEELYKTNEKYDEWFKRVGLGQDTKSKGKVITSKKYSSEEKEIIKKIDDLINSGKLTSEDTDKLLKIKKELGSVVTSGSIVTGISKLIALKGLGWNAKSGMTNFLEGRISNYLAASNGEYYDEFTFQKADNILYGLGQKGDLEKAIKLMEKYDVLQDQASDIQKATRNTRNKLLTAISPFEITKRVEFANQAPMMIAMLMNTKIFDSNGVESNVFDALDSQGNLKSEFKTNENLQWETGRGKDYGNFKFGLTELISRYHGNYHDLRGTLGKSTIAGSMLMTFKNWFPAQIYQRFAEEKVVLASGKRFKGRYRSFTPVSAAVFTGALGGLVGGPLFFALTPLLGYAAAKKFGIDSNQSVINELKNNAKSILKETAKLWVNISRFKTPDLLNNKDAYKLITDNELDQRNLQSNMADLSMILTMFLLKILAKGVFGEEEEEDGFGIPNKTADMITSNMLSGLISQASMYMNPMAIIDFGKNMPFSTFMSNVFKFIESIGNEVNTTGTHKGEYKMKVAFNKAFVPSFISASLGLGADVIKGDDIDGKDFLLRISNFKNISDREFVTNTWTKMFKSKAKKEAEENKQDRANLKLELENEGLTEEQAQKEVDIKFPTVSQKIAKLKKDYLGSDEKPKSEKSIKNAEKRKENKDLVDKMTKEDLNNIKINLSSLSKEELNNLTNSEKDELIFDLKKEAKLKELNKKIK